ncbi:MAG: hypothetical protein MJ208_01205 [Bacilli bacterium]|nr:hypothetical protein [Bacilli bacterium]
MTLKQFKWVDLLLFSVIAVVFEAINHFASVNLGSFQLIFMSFTIVLTLISMYRWGVSGLIVLIFASLISVVISPNNKEIEAYTSYICGGILGMLPGFLIFQLLIGKKRIKNTFIIISYLLFDFIMVILFRSLISSFFYLDKLKDIFVGNLQNLLVQESMSMFTSTVLLLIANRKNGNILVEMNKYVKEVHELKKLGGLKEMKESPNYNSDNPFTEFGQIDDSTILDGGTLDADQLKDLLKMYDESANIKIDNPMDCLTGQDKKEEKKDV